MHALPKEMAERVAEAIAAAERRTTAELKVVVLRHCWIDIRKKAQTLFAKHELARTRDRNGVMILLVLANREFLLYGDKGIHERVEGRFWIAVRDVMQQKFRAGRLLEGLCAGISSIGERLAEHFPATEDDANELSDEIVHED